MNYHSGLVGAALLLLFIVAGSADSFTIPAFDTSVKASSSVANMHDMIIESSFSGRTVSDETVPAALDYSFSVSSINGSDKPAEGMIRTDFIVKNLEARNVSYNTSADMSFHDSTAVVGQISNLMKRFSYESGVVI